MAHSNGQLIGIVSNLLEVEIASHVKQNEICYVVTAEKRLMGEVIKVDGDSAFIQLFEDSRGLSVGLEVEFTGKMQEVNLGPGMLGRKYDGLQNDLERMEGVFLQKGSYNFPIDIEQEWEFSPLVAVGDIVSSAEWVGEVQEYSITHKIMVPFSFSDECEVEWIAEKQLLKPNDVVVKLKHPSGEVLSVTMLQSWPAKIPVKAYKDKLRPFKMLETGVRVIDSLAPMLEGGTGFIPGPFGCGKTVLQHLLSKYADVDIVILAACGERANEIVEVFTEFPELEDPRTGRKLMERTVIIANTSNMPVAAREASVYTAMTIAEYYRSMGLKVLLLADSTSRWAQALREMSNRLEELPGPDAFPMDLSAIIANYYSRAGLVTLNNNSLGSITFIGTVSPAGGNLKEPVTESTKKAARCFYALSQKRADGKRYPAVDPIQSYSKYIDYPSYVDYAKEHISENWIANISLAKDTIYKGRFAADQINILGDDGVPIVYHIDFWKAELIDFALLQQDAFDDIDCSSTVERQNYMLEAIISFMEKERSFDDIERVGALYKKAINLCKQMNYSEFKSPEFAKYETSLDELS